LRVGDQTLTAVVTRDAVDELRLKRGDEATAIIKATEVMIAKETKEVERDKEKVSVDAKAGGGLKSKEDSEAPKVEEQTESISIVDGNEESIEKLKDGDKASQDNVEESVASSGNNSDEENIAVEESVPEDAIDVEEDNPSEEE